MTVTPFPSLLPTPPSGLGTAAGGTASADPAAAGFAALVASLVAGQLPGGTPTPAAGPTSSHCVPGEPVEDGDAVGEDEAPGDAAAIAAPPVTGLAAMISTFASAPGSPPVPAPGGAAGEAAVAATGTSPTAATTTAAPVTGDVATDQPPAAVATGSVADAAPAQAPEAVPAPSPAGVAGVAAPTSAAPTTTVAAPATPGAAEAGPVTRQVFPEVTRLVSAGNGTHRVTLSLQPEQLGEVRVTLTVRDGEVVVRMAAGDDAQRALLEGAPELRRVLELSGATDTRIVVRDLPTATGHTTASPAPGEGRDGSGQAGDRTHDQHAGTRGGSTARDGSTQGAGDGPAGGATPPAPGRPVTGTRAAGLDVTI